MQERVDRWLSTPRSHSAVTYGVRLKPDTTYEPRALACRNLTRPALACVAAGSRTPGRHCAKPERGRSDSSARLPSTRFRCFESARRFMPRNGWRRESAARRAGGRQCTSEAAFPAAASASRWQHTRAPVILCVISNRVSFGVPRCGRLCKRHGGAKRGNRVNEYFAASSIHTFSLHEIARGVLSRAMDTAESQQLLAAALG